MNLCGWFPRVVSHRGLEERLSLILNALAECLPCSVHLSTQSSGCPHLWIRVWCSGSCCSTQPAASHSHACASSGLLAGGHRVRALCQLPGLVVVSSSSCPVGGENTPLPPARSTPPPPFVGARGLGGCQSSSSLGVEVELPHGPTDGPIQAAQVQRARGWGGRRGRPATELMMTKIKRQTSL